MNISIIGCGRWGSLIAWYLSARRGLSVTLYGRPSSPHMARFLRERRNDLLTLPDEVRLVTTLDEAILPETEVVVISIGAQGLRALMQELQAYDLAGKTLVLCMKGLEEGTGKRLSEIAEVMASRRPLPDAVISTVSPFTDRRAMTITPVSVST